jgi:iron complex transport system substrate-binding protein
MSRIDKMARNRVGRETDNHIFGRRSFLIAASALPVMLAGCSAEPASNEVEPDASAFPVTLTHAFGSTEIEALPNRVVVLAAMEADLCAGLGLVPVAMPRIADTPWFRRAINVIQGERPIHLDDSQGPPIEVIAELKPDLILAMSTELSVESYNQLSGIAPVVAAQKNDVADGWRELATITGRALGREKEVSALIEAAEELVTEAVRDYDGLNGATALYVEASTVQGADVVVHGAESIPMRVMREFGLADAPSLRSLASEYGTDDGRLVSFVLPHERAGELSADALIVAISGKELSEYRERGELPALPRFGDSPVHFIAEADAIAMQTGSPLALEWIGRNLVPEFAKLAYLSSRKNTP